MTMPPEQLTMDDLDDRDRDVLRVLADGRANPKLVRNETGLDKGDANTVLVRLGRAGLVEQLTRGLYEITSEGRAEIDAPRTTIDPREIETALDDLERALQNGDKHAAEDALDALREVVDDA